MCLTTSSWTLPSVGLLGCGGGTLFLFFLGGGQEADRESQTEGQRTEREREIERTQNAPERLRERGDATEMSKEPERVRERCVLEVVRGKEER